MTVSLPDSMVPVWSCSVSGGAGRRSKRGGVDEIISQLIQRRDGAECAGALAELSIQSPPQPGSEEARRWHISRKLISQHAFHHRGGKKAALALLVPHPPSTHSLYAGTSLSASYRYQFFPFLFVADLSLLWKTSPSVFVCGTTFSPACAGLSRHPHH